MTGELFEIVRFVIWSRGVKSASKTTFSPTHKCRRTTKLFFFSSAQFPFTFFFFFCALSESLQPPHDSQRRAKKALRCHQELRNEGAFLLFFFFSPLFALTNPFAVQSRSAKKTRRKGVILSTCTHSSPVMSMITMGGRGDDEGKTKRTSDRRRVPFCGGEFRR